MARGKLVDKCRNMIYKGGEKCYIRKRKNENIRWDIPEEKIFIEKGTWNKNLKNKNQIVVQHSVPIYTTYY